MCSNAVRRGVAAVDAQPDELLGARHRRGRRAVDRALHHERALADALGRLDERARDGRAAAGEVDDAQQARVRLQPRDRHREDPVAHLLATRRQPYLVAQTLDHLGLTPR
jgi:hypothetical protein